MIDVKVKIYNNLSSDSLSFKEDSCTQCLFTCHVYDFDDMLKKLMTNHDLALVECRCYDSNTGNFIDKFKLMCRLTQEDDLTYIEVTNDVYEYFI